MSPRILRSPWPRMIAIAVFLILMGLLMPTLISIPIPVFCIYMSAVLLMIALMFAAPDYPRGPHLLWLPAGTLIRWHGKSEEFLTRSSFKFVQLDEDLPDYLVKAEPRITNLVMYNSCGLGITLRMSAETLKGLASWYKLQKNEGNIENCLEARLCKIAEKDGEYLSKMEPRSAAVFIKEQLLLWLSTQGYPGCDIVILRAQKANG